MSVIFPVFAQDSDKGWDREGKPVEFFLEGGTIRVRPRFNETSIQELRDAILTYARVATSGDSFEGEVDDVVDLFRAVEQNVEGRRWRGKVWQRVRGMIKRLRGK
jgi:hypothetical protein